MKGQSWRLRRPVPPGPAPWMRLARDWDLSQSAARLIWMREAEAPEELAFRLDPSWERSSDPFLMHGMGEAVERIRLAIRDDEPVCVYGDYDADGVTATALLVRVLERLGAQVRFFIPNRFDDGYGLNLECIRQLAEEMGSGLVVSVDCGVRSVDEVRAGRELGLDWVITDHHALGQGLPAAAAVVHPALDAYPNPHLSGVGVAFKLAQALLDAAPRPKGNEAAFLDGLLKLVAIGTIADLVPLRGENVLLVRRGLEAFAGANSPGLTALLRSAKLEGPMTAQDIAFSIAPRLNAAGRLGEADEAVRLLLARDPREAQALAERLAQANEARRAIQRELLASLPAPSDPWLDFVLEAEAHKGVIGIVAGQRMRGSGLPTAVCAVLDGLAHGSLRAPEGFDVLAMIEKARVFLNSGGGHRSAGGITFDPARRAFVQSAMREEAKAQAGRLGIRILSLDGMGAELIPGPEELRRLQPFGQGFPEPAIRLEGPLEGRPTAFGQGHARFRLEGARESCTWFSAPEEIFALPAATSLRVAVAPQDHSRFGRSWNVLALLEAEGTP